MLKHNLLLFVQQALSVGIMYYLIMPVTYSAHLQTILGLLGTQCYRLCLNIMKWIMLKHNVMDYRYYV